MSRFQKQLQNIINHIVRLCMGKVTQNKQEG